MTKSEKFLAGLERMKTGENAAILEGIRDAFNLCRKKSIDEVNRSIAVLEGIRGNTDKVAFFESVCAAVAGCDEKDRKDAVSGMEFYKEFLLK